MLTSQISGTCCAQTSVTSGRCCKLSMTGKKPCIFNKSHMSPRRLPTLCTSNTICRMHCQSSANIPFSTSSSLPSTSICKQHHDIQSHAAVSICYSSLETDSTYLVWDHSEAAHTLRSAYMQENGNGQRAAGLLLLTRLRTLHTSMFIVGMKE